MAPVTRVKTKPAPKSESEYSSPEESESDYEPESALEEPKKKKRKSTPYKPLAFKLSRMNETPEEKAKRLAKQRETYKRRIANETPEQRDKRLQKTREINNRRNQRLREDETPEEREERIRVKRDVRQLLAKCETDDQRRARQRGLRDRMGAMRRKKIQLRHPLTANLEDHDFYCELCSTIVIMRFRYVTHMHHHMNKTGYRMNIHEPIVLYICDYSGCQLCFRDKGRFVSHLESHSDTRSTFKCTVCQKPFAMESNCEKHFELAHGSEAADNVDCEYCHLVIKKEEWEGHYATHQIRLDEKEANHICEACGKSFGKLTNMKTHIRVVHMQPKPVDPTPRSKKSASQLKKDLSSAPCIVCGKLLINKEDTDKHMLRFHTYEHGTECYVCGKRYELLHTLLSHIRKLHTNEPKITKRASCRYCPRDFSGYWMMNKHHFIDHRAEYLREKAFCCGVCFRHFAAKQALMDHLLVHERLKCPVCLHRSICKVGYNFHLRTHNVGPLAATKKRNIKYKKGRRETLPVQVDDSEKKVVEGANHYFERNVGWLEIPNDLSNDHPQIENPDGPCATEEPPTSNPILPVANTTQYFHFMLHDQDRPPESLGLLPVTTNLPESGPPQIPEDLENLEIVPETETLGQIQTQDQDQESASASTQKQKKYKCDRCSLQFNFPKYLLVHIAWHVSHETENVDILATPAVAAETVLSENPTELELAKYLNPDYEEPEGAGVEAKRHVCPECAELFHHLPNLNRHRRMAHGIYVESGQQPVNCELCSLTFSRQCYLDQHIRASHNKKSQQKSSTTNDNAETTEHEPSAEDNDDVPWSPALDDGDDRGFDTNAESDEEKQPTIPPLKLTKLKSSDRPRRKQGRPRKIEKNRSSKKSRKSSTFVERSSETSNATMRDKWTCGECPMAFIRETALKQHKLTHEAARIAKVYEDPDSEWILPDIKMEPQDDDDDLGDPEWENEAGFLSPSPQSDYDEDEELLRPVIERLPSLRQIKLHTTRLLSKLAPELRQAAKSLPSQLVIQIPRVEVPVRRKAIPKFKIKKEFQEIQKKAKNSRRTAARSSKKRKLETRPKKPRRMVSKHSVPSDPEDSEPKPKRKKWMGRKRQQCEICGKDFHPNTHMDAHMATHSNIKPFKCETCNKGFAHEKLLKDHLRRNHIPVVPTPQNTCPVCGKVFKNVSTIEAHIASHSGVLPFECEVCHKKFPHERQMYDHKRRNHLEVPLPRKSQKGLTLIKKPGFDFDSSEYYCDICYTTIKYKRRYDRHMRTHFDIHPELQTVFNTYQCDACPQAFRLHAQFIRHLESHSPAESNTAVICSICKKAFAQVVTLESHIKNVHESLDTVHDCSYCHRSFSKEADFKIHQKAHILDLTASLDGRHMCAHCGQTFKLLSTLNGHILLTHEGEGMDPSVKPRFNLRKDQGGKVSNNDVAPCQVCGEKFGVRQALKSHLLKEHTYEHGLICFVCNKKFSLLGHLTRHLRDFHKDVQILADRTFPKNSKGKRTAYSCPHCPVVYYGGTLRLNKHLFRVHHEEYMQGKPVYCQLCFKNFATEEELVAHRPAHDGIKCDRCGEQFLRMAFLNTHMLRCAGESRPRPTKSTPVGGKKPRRPRSDKNMTARNSSVQLPISMEMEGEGSSGSSEDEEYPVQPVYQIVEAQPVPTHSLGLVQHPLHLVHPPPWLPQHQQQQTAEDLHFTMESFLHWN